MNIIGVLCIRFKLNEQHHSTNDACIRIESEPTFGNIFEGEDVDFLICEVEKLINSRQQIVAYVNTTMQNLVIWPRPLYLRQDKATYRAIHASVWIGRQVVQWYLKRHQRI